MDEGPPTRYRRAVVIGGGIAGLLAARVLSDHFQEVTIIERENLAQSPEPRQAIPQGRHVHVLLHEGIRIFERLFPDLVPALTEAGLTLADTSSDFRWRHFGVWKVRFHSGVDILFLNRPLFEYELASRVTRIPNVTVLDRCEVAALLATPGADRVTGLAIRSANHEEPELAAELVVDAGGRGSQMPQWLRAIGLPPPDEAVIEVNVGYASRIYRRPARAADWTALFVLPRAPDKRGAAVFPIDGNRWLVTLAGWLGDCPPAGDREFLEFARSLEVADVGVALESAEPLTAVSVHRFPANRRSHYEKLKRLPDGLLVMGDALCSFNPVYAQGMTVAALEAIALDRCLRRHSRTRYPIHGLGRSFHQAASGILDAPWQLATGEDLRYAEVEGRRPLGTGFMHWYGGLVHQATARDRRVAREFYKVMHLTQPPALLFHPGVVVRTLSTALRHREPPNQASTRGA